MLALAHQIGEENCTIYSQDISQKSNEFLRLNLSHSLSNVIHGDTLVNPAHINKEKNRLEQFDYIVSNPPFKTDFSETRETLSSEKYRERFFAGVPQIPKKDKDSMPIYLMFIQHILYSLKDDGKAAIVVPTGFITAKNGIEKKLLTYLVDNKYIKGVISMPKNLFATTGTNVSLLIIDKSSEVKDVMMIDASEIGEKVKDGKNQRTLLSNTDVELVINSYLNKELKDDFSVLVPYEKIMSNNYSLNPGQYFEYKIDIKELSDSEFNSQMDTYISNLNNMFSSSHEIEKNIIELIKDLKI